MYPGVPIKSLEVSLGRKGGGMSTNHKEGRSGITVRQMNGEGVNSKRGG